MKEFKNEISKDCVKSSPFRGLRGGMLLMFSLASLYLLFAERKVTEMNTLEQRMVDNEIVIPSSPDYLENCGMDVAIYCRIESEMSQETIESKPVSPDSTNMENISVSEKKINPGSGFNEISK